MPEKTRKFIYAENIVAEGEILLDVETTLLEALKTLTRQIQETQV